MQANEEVMVEEGGEEEFDFRAHIARLMYEARREDNENLFYDTIKLGNRDNPNSNHLRRMEWEGEDKLKLGEARMKQQDGFDEEEEYFDEQAFMKEFELQMATQPRKELTGREKMDELQFEQLWMREYEEEGVGVVDGDEEEEMCLDYDSPLFLQALEEFDRKFTKHPLQDPTKDPKNNKKKSEEVGKKEDEDEMEDEEDEIEYSNEVDHELDRVRKAMERLVRDRNLNNKRTIEGVDVGGVEQVDMDDMGLVFGGGRGDGEEEEGRSEVISKFDMGRMGGGVKVRINPKTALPSIEMPQTASKEEEESGFI